MFSSCRSAQDRRHIVAWEVLLIKSTMNELDDKSGKMGTGPMNL